MSLASRRSSPGRNRVGDGRWRRLPRGKRTRFEGHGHTGLDFSSQRRTIPGTFRRGVGDTGKDRTY